MNIIEESIRPGIDCFNASSEGDPTVSHVNNWTVAVKPGYHLLHEVLVMALNQAQDGKGNVRHANGKSFEEQPIMNITRMVGTGFCHGQAIKKLEESIRLDPESAIAEQLGAIIYIAASIMRLNEIK